MKAIGPIIGCAILIAVKELIDALSGSSAKAKAA